VRRVEITNQNYEVEKEKGENKDKGKNKIKYGCHHPTYNKDSY